MAKKIAVYLEQVSEDEFVVWTNGDEPAKSVNNHCVLVQRTVRPGWRTGIAKWLADNGFSIHPDSDYTPGAVDAFADQY